MLRAALLSAVALAGAFPAFAQARCVASGPGVQSAAEYVEARRPVVSKRKLTNDEKAVTKKLVSSIRARINDKNSSVKVADLEALAPYGNSGDREIMKALSEGYLDLAPGDIHVTDAGVTNYFGKPAVAAEHMLAGLWGMQLWIDGDRSREMARALANCVGTDADARYGSGRCGFEAEFSEKDYDKGVDSYAQGKGRLPKAATFREKSLLMPFGDEEYRFKLALTAYRRGDNDRSKQAWGECWAKRQGGEYAALWDNSSATAQAAQRLTQETSAAQAERETLQNPKDWEALQARRVEAKAQGGELSNADYAKWIRLSYKLGGKYLVPLASEVYLREQSAIESLCRQQGEVCDRQRRIWDQIASEARNEAEMKEARWRAAIEDNSPGSTSVRTYDQSGNYLGATSMPKWQADILSGR